MKINEIQIGDWVRLDYVDYLTKERIVKDFKVGQLRFLDWDGRGQMYVGDDHQNMAVVDNLNPIPITEEILEKNGFEKDPETGEMIWCNDETEIIWLGTMLNVRCECGICELTTIMYVHELQHAMRLLGIEKEIKL